MRATMRHQREYGVRMRARRASPVSRKRSRVRSRKEGLELLPYLGSMPGHGVARRGVRCGHPCIACIARTACNACVAGAACAARLACAARPACVAARMRGRKEGTGLLLYPGPVPRRMASPSVRYAPRMHRGAGARQRGGHKLLRCLGSSHAVRPRVRHRHTCIACIARTSHGACVRIRHLVVPGALGASGRLAEPS